MARALLLFLIFSFSLRPCLAQSNTDVYKVTSPVQGLTDQFGSSPTDNTEPFKSGVLTPDQAPALLQALHGESNKPTIIHVLRWKDAGHTTVSFQKWYFYDPTPSKGSFYLQSKEQVFQRTATPGYTEFQFVYLHLNAVIASGAMGGAQAGALDVSPPTLIHPVNYTITVTKAQTQFVQDLKTALQIIGIALPTGAAPAAIPANPGYFAVTTFESQWTTSGITIAASLDASNKVSGTTQNSTSNSLSSNTYTNEKPSWVGLSAGVQITSYKDLTFQSSSGTLVPSTVTKQGVYFFLDGYVPPVLPSLSSFRYIPHPFFGLPIQGKVLRHSMVGLGIGLHWLEPYGGVVFDTQNNQVKGMNINKTGITYQYVFGVKMSMSAVAKALKAKSSGS
jgi:hypothetical protein